MSAESAKISTELVEEVVSTLESKRIKMQPDEKAKLVRHMCDEILEGSSQPCWHDDEILVGPAMAEEVVYEVETWLELNQMELDPIDKADLVRSICEEAAAGAKSVKGIAWRKLSDYLTDEQG